MGKVLDLALTSLLPGVSDPVESNFMYGAPPAFFEAPKAKSTTAFRPSVHISDRKANMEAMLVAFLAEKSLPFTMAGKKILIP